MSTGALTARERAVGLIAAFRGIHWDEERAIDVAANTLTAHAAAAVEQRDREWRKDIESVQIEMREWGDVSRFGGKAALRLLLRARTPTTPETSASRPDLTDAQPS